MGFAGFYPTDFGDTSLDDGYKREMIDSSFDKTFIWLCDPGFSNRLLPPYVGLSEPNHVYAARCLRRITRMCTDRNR